MKTLLAEDDTTSRMLLDAAMTKWGCDVVSVADGHAAWAELQRAEGPKLAVLDWMMPGMDGIEICRRIRSLRGENAPYVYVILLTSKSAKGDLVAGMEAGADDYLTKPFDYEELRARIKSGERIIKLETQLVAAREQLRFEATHDSLTGAMNRRAVTAWLEVELDRSGRDGKPLYVAMADLDHFKTVNDTYGHAAGDAVLREFAARVQGCLRPYDVIGRFGGEEFLLIVPGASAAVFHRIREVIADEAINFKGVDIPVTASFGAALWDGDVSADTLVAAADHALYRAKDRGRNRVEFAPEKRVAMLV